MSTVARPLGRRSPVHVPLDILFEMAPASFSRVLMLIVGLTLPVIDEESMEDVLDSLGYFDLSTISDEHVHSSPFSYDIFEGVDKLAPSSFPYCTHQ